MHIIHLLPSVAAIQPNLELKTRPKQLLGSLPLVIALPDNSLAYFAVAPMTKKKILTLITGQLKTSLEESW
jgi:hypothetical protein